MPAGRKPEVNYWSSRGAYFVIIKGKTHKLAEGPKDGPFGPTYAVALAKYRQLLEDDMVNHVGDRNTVRAIYAAYRNHMKTACAPKTIKLRESMLGPFVAHFGERTIASLVANEIKTWLDAQGHGRWSEWHRRVLKWSASTRRGCLDCINSLFNWAKKLEMISRNPAQALDKTKKVSRGEEAYLTTEEFQLVLSKATPDERDLLIVLRHTGARPGEIVNARGADWNANLKAIVYRAKPIPGQYRHKNARHDRDRTVYIGGPALEVIERRLKLYGNSFLFPAISTGRGYKAGIVRPKGMNRICGIFEELRWAANLPHLSAYSLRHTYCTDWLQAGGDIEKLAIVIGSSPRTIRQHYSHLDIFKENHSQLVEAFTVGR